MQSNTWRPSDILTADTPGGRIEQRDSPKRRGRIPQSAWPRIVERYKAGATLSAIAREFDCTPSAISYILRKASGNTDADGPANGRDGSEVRERKTMTLARSERRGEDEGGADETAAREETTAETRGGAAETPAAGGGAPRVEQPAASGEGGAKTVVAGRREGTTSSDNGASGPADPLEARLLETAKGCIRAYRNWRQEANEDSVQALREGLHNLRKTLARVEIEASTHKRDEAVVRPIPIPLHRAHRSRG